MILSNVNIGTAPSAGDGDPLRSAFSTINNNFQIVKNNVNALTNSVSSVAGRTGNVVLTVNDVIGAASIAYVNSQLGNAGSYSNINVTAFLPTYLGSIATVTAANIGMKGYVDTSIAGLVDSAPGTLDTLNELAAALGDDPNLSVTLVNTINNANTSMKAYVDGQIAAANTNATYSNVNTLAYLTTNSYTTQAYVDGQIAAANTNATYSNVNVSSFLPSYSGNIAVNTLQFDDLSEQHTAYTGTQWRSNLSSNVTVKPSWMSYYPGLKNQLGTQYGFDASGMFFSGNADNDIAYPIRTNLHIHGEDTTEIIATINFAHTGDDHGIAIFNSDTVPIWKYSTDTTRIAFQFSSGTPRLYGRTTQDVSGTPVITAGNTYTIKFTYSPGNTVTVQTYAGTDTSGTLLDTRSISEVLPAGDYVIGFDADQDTIGDKSYFTNIIVRTLTNTVVNNLEVVGQVAGNIIPSANVTYSLGNITHQWKDLWVSNTTIYIGGTPLAITNGNLTVNGAPVSGGSTYSNVQLAADLSTNTGNVQAGNVFTTAAYRFGTTTASITQSSGTLILSPDTATDALAGIRINGSGYLLGPNGSRNITLNYGSVGGAVGLQSNVTVGTAATGHLWVNGNVLARDVTAGNVSTTGIVKTAVHTVATLPSASSVGAGARSFVSDADAVIFGNLAVGGGPYYLPVFSNGTNWYLG